MGQFWPNCKDCRLRVLGDALHRITHKCASKEIVLWQAENDKFGTELMGSLHNGGDGCSYLDIILPAWQYDVEVGATVSTIVQRAHELRAELVILGLPQHNFFRRAFVRDTMQGIAENTQSAVLAVRPELTHRPESILVAVDFSITSLRAAHLACQLVAPGGRIILVYVQPDLPPESSADSTRMTADGTSTLESALASLIDELTCRKTVTITSIIEHGSSIHGVKEAALRMNPDAIALGARHHSAVDWFFGDSVSTELVSERRWSLLLVPE